MIRITFIAVISAAVNAEIILEDKVHAWTIFLTLKFIFRSLTKLSHSKDNATAARTMRGTEQNTLHEV